MLNSRQGGLQEMRSAPPSQQSQSILSLGGGSASAESSRRLLGSIEVSQSTGGCASPLSPAGSATSPHSPGGVSAGQSLPNISAIGTGSRRLPSPPGGTRSLPSSPAFTGRKLLGKRQSHSAESALAASFQITTNFLSRLEDLRKGPLYALELLLDEAKTLQTRALQATTASTERQALRKVEACHNKAGQISTSASATLQELAAEACAAGTSGSSQADLRRQSLAGTSTKLQHAVGAIFQAQRTFREDFEAKRARQLRTAFPDASQEAVNQVAARSSSAASTIQDTVNLQPGSGPLTTGTAMMAIHEEFTDLQNLAESARQLRSAFEQTELLVNTQGEIIGDIAVQVHAARNQTEQAVEQLYETTQAQNRCRRRQLAMVLCVLLLVAAVVLYGLYVLHWH